MKVSEHIDLIDGTNAHVYVFKSGDQYVQVDAGMRGSAKRVLAYYEAMGVRPSVVLITHSHVDHVGGLRVLYDLYKPRIYADPSEIPVIRGERPQYSASPLMKFFSSLVRISPVPSADDVSRIDLPKLVVVKTPGHTPGSTTYVLESGEKKFAFVGDAAFEKGGQLYVNRRYALDLKEAEASLRRVMGLAPVTVLPGHGNPLELKRHFKRPAALRLCPWNF